MPVLKEGTMNDLFRQFARVAANAVGSPAAFLLGVAAAIIWAATGSYFHYSDTWQLVINTGTSIGTFLIVLKLDELIRAIKHARTELVHMETLSDAELDELQQQFESCRDGAAQNLKLLESRIRRPSPNSETGTMEVDSIAGRSRQ
jgi:low affinity Fe/Cu permease